MQQNENSKLERIHSLDALRATMMLLGILLHSALYYGTIEYNIGLQDQNTQSISMDLLIVYIHTFRMPIFFFVAGFFAAFLLYTRSPKEMLKNRLLRVFLPFAVFLAILTPLINYAYLFTQVSFLQSATPFVDAFNKFKLDQHLLPFSTGHLWFLYYLTFFSLATFIIHKIFVSFSQMSAKISQIFEWIFEKPILKVMFFSSFMLLIYISMGTSELETSFSLVPKIETFVFYFYFYGVGWLLFKSKNLLPTMNKYSFTFVILASILVFVKVSLIVSLDLGTSSDAWYLMVLNSFSVWLFLFGITGIFLKYFSFHSKKMRYISDASYWIYLIHSPFVDFFPAFWINLPLIAEFKFLLNISLTFAVCIITYKYFVRKTFIGAFLNGKRYI